jgi:hypothetical protein
VVTCGCQGWSIFTHGVPCRTIWAWVVVANDRVAAAQLLQEPLRQVAQYGGAA